MGNIPLQNGGQFINPVQKRGVDPNWNTQQYEYAKSIISGFNAMGQQIGNDMTRLGKAMMRQEEEESDKAEREATMNDAHSISLLKIRQGEDFSHVEKTIAAKEYKTLEEFDADWHTNILPQLDETHEALMQDADIVWNRQRLQPQAQRVYEAAREQFRVKTRASVDARVTQRRQENAAKALSVAGANADIPSIMAGRDAAIAAGIAPDEVESMTRGAMFEAFDVAQRASMEQFGGVNSAGYKIAMHNALSTARDNISESIRAILNAEDEKIFDAWKAGDFSEIIGSADKKVKAQGTSKATSAAKKAQGKKDEDKLVLGEDWASVRKAGIEATEEVHRKALEEIDAAEENGIITSEDARRMRESEEAKKQESLRKVDSNILAQRSAAKKEQRDLIKSLIETAATNEEAFLELCTSVQYSGNVAVNFSEKLNWMRERPASEYDAAKSRATLLRIYANAGRLKDETDSEGSYRLSALALARKNCNAEDYAKAISFLAGGEKDSASQKLIEQGMARLFDVAGVKAEDIEGTDDDGWLAAYCEQVAQLAGNLPPATFRHEIDGLCKGLQEEQNERSRIRYLDSYINSVTRDIADIKEQQDKSFDFATPSDEAALEREKMETESEEKKKRDKEAAEKRAKEMNASLIERAKTAPESFSRRGDGRSVLF